MAERYSRIYTLPGNLYSDSAPILIVAGALLKDNQTGKMLAQLKLQNLDERIVTGITLNFVLFDAEGKQIGEPFAHQFSQISVESNSYFGQKEPVILPGNDVCSYQVSIHSVILSGGKVWEQEAEWKPLSPEVDIAHIRQSLTMIRQKEEEEELREIEELERQEELLREERALEIQRERKKTTRVVMVVLVAIIVLCVVINAVSDSQTKKNLLPDLIGSSWQYHVYYDDIDWDYTVTIEFVNAENIIFTSESIRKQNKEPQYEDDCTWKFSSISSDKATITVKHGDGTTSKYTIHYKMKDGQYEITKLISTSQYNIDSVYYRVR